MIIDSFTFHNEFQMLSFRLHTLYPYVDKFVIVEADKCFNGDPKIFHTDALKLHKDSFLNKFADKISYHKVYADISGLDLLSKPDKYDPLHDCWKIEYQQRNAIVAACEEFADDDILMMGDVDEIPSLDAIKWAKQNSTKLPGVCQQDFFYYDLKHLRQEEWCGTIISTVRTARSLGTQELRNRRNVLPRMVNAGYHLSYFGGTDQIRNKIESFSHQELNVPEFKDEAHIEQCRKTGGDLFNRGVPVVEVGPEHFPVWFREKAKGFGWGIE